MEKVGTGATIPTMKKHAIISIAIIFVLVIIPLAAHAATFLRTDRSFGGKVLQTAYPSNFYPLVTCAGLGTGPLTMLTAPGSVQTPFPYYAMPKYGSLANFVTVPKMGSWILGVGSPVVDSYTCYLYESPFPVTDTYKYGTS